MQLAQAIDAWVEAHGTSLSASTQRDISHIATSIATTGWGELPCNEVDRGVREDIIGEAASTGTLGASAITEFLNVVTEWEAEQSSLDKPFLDQQIDDGLGPSGAFLGGGADVDEEEAPHDFDAVVDEHDVVIEQHGEEYDGADADQHDATDVADEHHADHEDLDSDETADDTDPDVEYSDETADDTDPDAEYNDELDSHETADDTDPDVEYNDDRAETDHHDGFSADGLPDGADEQDVAALDDEGDSDWGDYLAGDGEAATFESLAAGLDTGPSNEEHAAASSFFDVVESSQPSNEDEPVVLDAAPAPSGGGVFSAAAKHIPPKPATGIDWITVAYFTVAAICFAALLYFYLNR